MHHWHTVYSLAEDAPRLAEYQRVSQTTDQGLRLDYGLVGSEEWWANIQAHRLPLQHQEGTLVELFDGPMGDWPSLVLADKSGRLHRWTNPGGVGHEQVGHRLRIEFVEMAVKKPPHKGFRTRVVLRVQVGK